MENYNDLFTRSSRRLWRGPSVDIAALNQRLGQDGFFSNRPILDSIDARIFDGQLEEFHRVRSECWKAEFCNIRSWENDFGSYEKSIAQDIRGGCGLTRFSDPEKIEATKKHFPSAREVARAFRVEKGEALCHEMGANQLTEWHDFIAHTILFHLGDGYKINKKSSKKSFFVFERPIVDNLFIGLSVCPWSGSRDIYSQGIGMPIKIPRAQCAIFFKNSPPKIKKEKIIADFIFDFFGAFSFANVIESLVIDNINEAAFFFSRIAHAFLLTAPLIEAALLESLAEPAAVD